MTAKEQYMETQAMIALEILKLKEQLADHLPKNAEDIHWGHVGDVEHTLAHIKELTEGEEE